MELEPTREQARQQYTQRIKDYIAGLAVATQTEVPMGYIGYEDNEVVS